MVVEGDNALGRPREIGYDEADARVQLVRMPLDLGHDVARLVPALRLIAEAGIRSARSLGWSPDRTLQQIVDPAVQDVAGETKYPVRKMLIFAIDAITDFSIAPLRIRV